MSPRKAIDRLRDIVAQDLDSLAPNTILPDGRGYLVFEIYSLQPEQGLWRVVKRRNHIADMTNLRTAVSWCVADKYQQHQLSTEIITLDQHKLLVESDLHAREALARRPGLMTSSDAMSAKLATRRQRLLGLEQRLAKCVNVAKYWQLRGFNNETARAGRTASHRTHR